MGDVISIRRLIDQRGVLPRHERLLKRFMAALEREGYVERSGAGEWLVERDVSSGGPGVRWRNAVADHPAMLPELKPLHRFGTHLKSALCGEADPVELLFPDASMDMAEGKYESMRSSNAAVELCVRQVIEGLGQGRSVRILEVGGGTGGITANILPVLPAEQTQYVFTDITPFFLAKAEQKFRVPFLDFKVFNVEEDPIAQGFEPQSFDIVLASHIFHATQNLRQTLTNVAQVMAPGGLLIFLEVEQVAAYTESMFGLMDGWWRFDDYELRPDYPLMKAAQWKKLLREVGFEEVGSLPVRSKAEERPVVLLARSPRPEPVASKNETTAEAKGRWLIFADEGGVGERLSGLIEDSGGSVVLASRGKGFQPLDQGGFEIRPTSLADLKTLCRTASQGSKLRGIIHLWSLDATTCPDARVSLEDAERWGCHSVMYALQAVTELDLWAPTTQLLFVTRNAQPVGDHMQQMSILQSPLLGLARVIRNEHSNLHSKLVDLGWNESPECDAQLLLRELGTDDPDPEIVLRDGVRFVPRLQRFEHETARIRWLNQEPRPRFALTIPQPGALDRLQMTELEKPEVGPGEVEIQVVTAALNFRDVMKALGFYPTDSPDATILGDECAGRITRVGGGVSGLKVGDEVIAIAPGSFASHVLTRADLVVRKPRYLSFSEAVTMPVVFLTAYYALVHLGQLRPGERVLIHAAAGGVGLAAVQIAAHVGARVFATAGSPEKRQILSQMGVEHVMDSRSLAFADEIMRETGGRGVDLVLNSLSGQAIAKGVACLAGNGRFVELGKRDIYQNSKLGLWNFRKNLSYFAVDLGRLLENAPVLSRALLHEFPRMLRARTFRPLTHTGLPLSRAVEGFRCMVQAKHVGKIVLSARDSSLKAIRETAQRSTTPGRRNLPDHRRLRWLRVDRCPMVRRARGWMHCFDGPEWCCFRRGKGRRRPARTARGPRGSAAR